MQAGKRAVSVIGETLASSALIASAGERILRARPKMIALSGPGGFLGARVLDAVLDAHEYRLSLIHI